jgi:hypothetical protein
MVVPGECVFEECSNASDQLPGGFIASIDEWDSRMSKQELRERLGFVLPPAIDHQVGES